MKITFNSPVILTFSILCAAVYLLTGPMGLLSDSFKLLPGWNLSSPGWYFRLFSHTMGHASTEHLMGNLAFILLIGPIVEEKYGAKNLVIMMLSTALVTSVLHLSFFDHGLLGASGIVFMLILVVSLVNFRSKEIPLTFILVVIIFIGKEIMDSMQDDGVSHFAHIVGGITGAVFGFTLGSKKA
ncbi:MAG: rhomboid family intramembrane serine protease [Bacteroidetes bacterium]|nr:rhomboid family intramembrane serine protease [Bacteroidota bacterium]